MLYIIIQARSGSTRLPKKVMEDIKGTSMIQRIYDICHGISANTIVAIPRNDTELADFLYAHSIPFFGGAEEDVLQRYYDCAMAYKASAVVRVTGDCPCLDQAKLFHIINICNLKNVDFGSNVFAPRTSIDGDDIEYMSARFLKHLYDNAKGSKYREHVTLYAYENDVPKDFVIANFTNNIDLSHIKTSVDTPEDLERVRKMIV